MLLQFASVHSRMNFDSEFFFVCRLINWLSDQGRGKEAEEQAVHVAHDHQATRDAAESRSKKSPLETDKITQSLHSYWKQHHCDKDHLLDGKDDEQGHVREQDRTHSSLFHCALANLHFSPKAAWNLSPCIGLPWLHGGHLICEGGQTKARMTRPYSSSSHPLLLSGKKLRRRLGSSCALAGWQITKMRRMRRLENGRACVDLARTKESCPSEKEEEIVWWYAIFWWSEKRYCNILCFHLFKSSGAQVSYLSWILRATV